MLYVVDPYRSWYHGGDAELMQERYTARLQQYTQQYKHVVMIGDSMGATAALLFAPLATKVMSFCPQVCWGVLASWDGALCCRKQGRGNLVPPPGVVLAWAAWRQQPLSIIG